MDSQQGNHEEGKVHSRRKFVKNTIMLSGGIALGMGLAACKEDEEPEMKVGTISELKEQKFLSPKFNDKRILVREQEDEIVAFSLICRHKKCTVKWKAEKQIFQCPCHDGKYDENGFVIGGPPPGPLKRFKVEIRNQEIWVLNEYV